MAAYYNENDPFAVAWLRELIKEGLIADGEVDDRSIELVQPGDVRGFAQCHFFAGIGGWSYALRLAGWDDARAVWTGSCPCQPWSMAGEGKGTDDSRHLWPQWLRLIQVLEPATIFGEQTASEDGRYWLDLVYVDLEARDYAVGAADLPAAGVKAPHARQRLWFVADTRHAERRAQPPSRGRMAWPDPVLQGQEAASLISERGVMGNTTSSGSARLSRQRQDGVAESGGAGDVGHPNGQRLETGRSIAEGSDWWFPGRAPEPASALGGFWANAEWLYHRDGKFRAVEPGSFPVAAGVSGRMGRLRGYGNSICPQVAQVFIEAVMEIVA